MCHWNGRRVFITEALFIVLDLFSVTAAWTVVSNRLMLECDHSSRLNCAEYHKNEPNLLNLCWNDIFELAPPLWLALTFLEAVEPVEIQAGTECQNWLQACRITQNGISQSGCRLWCLFLHALLSVKEFLILRVVVFRGSNCCVSGLKYSLCLKILLCAYHFIFSILNMVSFHCLWSW